MGQICKWAFMGWWEKEEKKCGEYTGSTPAFSAAHDAACMYGHTYSKNMDQPGKVGNLARGQLYRENEYFPVRVRA